MTSNDTRESMITDMATDLGVELPPGAASDIRQATELKYLDNAFDSAMAGDNND